MVPTFISSHSVKTDQDLATVAGVLCSTERASGRESWVGATGVAISTAFGVWECTQYWRQERGKYWEGTLLILRSDYLEGRYCMEGQVPPRSLARTIKEVDQERMTSAMC